jgi:hypothetical protein
LHLMSKPRFVGSQILAVSSGTKLEVLVSGVGCSTITIYRRSKWLASSNGASLAPECPLEDRVAGRAEIHVSRDFTSSIDTAIGGYLHRATGGCT